MPKKKWIPAFAGMTNKNGQTIINSSFIFPYLGY